MASEDKSMGPRVAERLRELSDERLAGEGIRILALLAYRQGWWSGFLRGSILSVLVCAALAYFLG